MPRILRTRPLFFFPRFKRRFGAPSESSSPSSSPSSSESSSPSSSASSSASASAPSSIGSGYDIFLIAGQSNTYAGEPEPGDTQPDATLDSTDSDILQLGRYAPNVNTAILAQDPLDSHDKANAASHNWISWAIGFAKQWKANGYLESGRQVLIVHCGMGSTGFSDNEWNEGDYYYNDAVTRTTTALGLGSGTNVVQAILWHQGEDDVATQAEAEAHQAALLAMIDAMRTDLGDSNIPFIVGGMVPAGATSGYRPIVQAGLIDVPNQRSYTGYADPESPTELTSATGGTPDHFSGRSTRGYPTQTYTDYTTMGMAGRYWKAYQESLGNH